jgi:general secretion pathway protein G
MKTILPFLIVLTLLTGSLPASDSQEPKILGAETTIDIFQRAIERFRKDVGRYPSSNEGLDALNRVPAQGADHWKGPYLRAELPADPWGHPYRYRFPSAKSSVAFEIWSYGPDGIESDDDVGNWKKK